MDARELKQGRREAAWEGAVIVLTAFSLLLIAWVEFAGLRWPEPLFQTLALIDLAIVGVLVLDFLVRLFRAESRLGFLKRHGWEVLGMVPLYAESFSWLRLMRLARLARLLRLIRLVALSRRIKGTATFFDRLLFTHRLGPAVLVSSGVVLAMAFVVWVLERDHNPSFATFSDALWWAVVTASTVGYGDITPQSGLARFFAGTLMLVGIGMIGMLASTLSATLLQQVDSRFAEESGGGGVSVAGELERLAKLHEGGKLTDEEFTLAKQRVLRDPVAG